MIEPTREERLAAAFVDLADTLVGSFDIIHFLHMLAERCVELLDVSAAGVLLATPQGRLVEAAASDERTHKLELAAIEWDEGPCRDCYDAGTPVPDIRLDSPAARSRWPRFTPGALELDFTSVMAAPLRMHGQVIGALNLFRNRPGPLRAGQVKLGQALADTATIGILQQRAAQDQSDLTVQLQYVLDSRIVVEQAKGALAYHHESSADQAFRLMRAFALAHGIPLTEVARSVLDGTVNASLLHPES